MIHNKRSAYVTLSLPAQSKPNRSKQEAIDICFQLMLQSLRIREYDQTNLLIKKWHNAFKLQFQIFNKEQECLRHCCQAYALEVSSEMCRISCQSSIQAFSILPWNKYHICSRNGEINLHNKVRIVPDLCGYVLHSAVSLWQNQKKSLQVYKIFSDLRSIALRRLGMYC